MAIIKYPNTIAGKVEAEAVPQPRYIMEGAHITVFTGEDIPPNDNDMQQNSTNRYVTAGQFRDRFTSAELSAILAAQQSDVQIAEFLYLVATTADPFSLDDPRVVNGLPYLVSKGLLAANRPEEIRESPRNATQEG